jgi:Bacterial extracellular solute-binding protein
MIAMMHRRTFIRAGAAIAAMTSASASRARGLSSGDRAGAACKTLVWRPMTSVPADAPTLNGYTDTIPDIIGRVGAPIDLAIFTEGNHFPALLGGRIVHRFSEWARTHSEFSALRLDNVVIVTLPQPMIVAMLLERAISFGNLTLDVSRASGFFPDIVMGGEAPLTALHKASIVDGPARIFARNRGPGLLIAAGNPFGVNGLDDLTRNNIRVVMASESEPGARRGYISAIEGLIGRERARDVLMRETVSFPGRLGIQHRDVPYAIASGAAEAGVIFHHLAQYYAATYADIFAMEAVAGAERFSSTIAMAPVADPLRAPAARAFSDFFMMVAHDVYPRHGFATMAPADYGAILPLG